MKTDWRPVRQNPNIEVTLEGFFRKKLPDGTYIEHNRYWLNREKMWRTSVKVDGEFRHLNVHRVIYESFVRYLRQDERVCVLDGNYANLALSNIVLKTQKPNIIAKAKLKEEKSKERRPAEERLTSGEIAILKLWNPPQLELR